MRQRPRPTCCEAAARLPRGWFGRGGGGVCGRRGRRGRGLCRAGPAGRLRWPRARTAPRDRLARAGRRWEQRPPLRAEAEAVWPRSRLRRTPHPAGSPLPRRGRAVPSVATRPCSPPDTRRPALTPERLPALSDPAPLLPSAFCPLPPGGVHLRRRPFEEGKKKNSWRKSEAHKNPGGFFFFFF